jgi:hypothetical protein
MNNRKELVNHIDLSSRPDNGLLIAMPLRQAPAPTAPRAEPFSRAKKANEKTRRENSKIRVTASRENNK